MSERSHLVNGRFIQDLSGWTISGAEYLASDGDDHYGIAVLSTGGDYAEQQFSVPDVRSYSVHLAAKSASGQSASEVQLIITDGNDNQVLAQNVAVGAAAWQENTFAFGLAPGTNYTLRIVNLTAIEDVKIDDVWVWHVPLTRQQLANRVNAKLARLASERSLSTAASGANTEGDYTYAVDAGLMDANAINPETGLPDVRYLDPESQNIALDTIEREMLERLQRDYLTEVDFGLGPRRESRSQVAKGIGEILGTSAQGGGGGTIGKVIQRPLEHGRKIG